MQDMEQIICWPDWKTDRHYEHVRCIKTNNPFSAYALHDLNNRHEFGNPEQTMHFLKTCSKGKKMNCWESFYMEVLQQQDLLIDE
jgi:trans-aconitate methyltransferase